MKKILVTGSRSWTDVEFISDRLFEAFTDLGGSEDIVLISGGCPTGADRIAETHWKRGNLPLLVVPARWDIHDRSAGFVRNSIMVKYEPDIVLAFVKNKSNGASHTIKLALDAGLTVREYHVD